MGTSGVYRIFHGPTGMTYVGYSKDVDRRILKHKSQLRKRKRRTPFYEFFLSQTNGKDWFWELLLLEPEDSKAAEIQAIRRVPEHLRLNRIIYEYRTRVNKTEIEISNKMRFIAESKRKNKLGFPGISLQRNGRYKYRISWPGGTIRAKGFSTAEAAHEARVLRLRQLNKS